MKNNHSFQSAKLGSLVLMLSMALTGCATTTQQKTHSTQSMNNPKQILSDAVQSQLRSSFGYQTTISVSLPHDDMGKADAIEICQRQHDTAYIALLKSAKDDELRIANDGNVIKEAYLSCLNDNMSVNHYQRFDFENFYKQNQSLETSELEQKFIAEVQEHAMGQQEMLTGVVIASEPDPLAIKKSQLLNEYLIKPTKITITGNYQPLSGVITAIPEARYDAKNLTLAVSQPIYIDIKNGVVYLWADNIALIQSLALDKQLGDQWKDKWLAIPLNDGSLPKTFTQDFIKSYLKATKESYLALDATQMRQVNAQTVLDLPNFTKNLDDHTKNLIKNSKTIIQNAPDNKGLAYSRYVFADTLYNELIAKYPQLDNHAGDHEYEIIDGESHVNISTQTQQAQESSQEIQTKKINSQKFVTLIVNILKSQINHYYHVKLPNQDDYTKEPPVWHYGIDNGKISWIHNRKQFGLVNQIQQLTKASMSDKPIFIDTLTLIESGVKYNFDRLPNHARTPNTANSIDVLAYANEFVENFTSNNPYLPIMHNGWIETPTQTDDTENATP
ncbi:hypothetical protein LU276_04760 [Moraxella haemolytica]|uniref:hypothetical protein n=1 Tax=Moraxella haemolytica TaxID=2904119 RepID=UPI0025434A0C|nr:hypothetical protein [Moraxella sp. ZY171148]WII96126.1 hypothetical protein LU276_04760 [Moraxella sp. ZY171148]